MDHYERFSVTDFVLALFQMRRRGLTVLEGGQGCCCAVAVLFGSGMILLAAVAYLAFLASH